MAVFFYNTDAKSPRRRRYDYLISRGLAITGGPRSFGEQLRQLSQNDTVLMYENGLGVVAVGRVLQAWDGIRHATSQYYSTGEPDYRVPVEWYCDLSTRPIRISELKRRL